MTQKPHPGMHYEDIKAALRKRFGPITLLSLQWGLCRSAIVESLRNPRASQRVELLIANALQKAPHEIWPDRWDISGAPLPRCSLAETIRRRTASASQIREAA